MRFCDAPQSEVEKLPRARKLFLKLDNQTYRLNYLLLRIPVRPRESCFIRLAGGEYQLSFLATRG